MIKRISTYNIPSVFILLIFVLSAVVKAQPNCQWTKGYGNTKEESCKSVYVDASGNVYSTGYFYSPTITFGSTTLTNFDNSCNSCDAFIVKSDSCGNVIWAKKAGDDWYVDEGAAISADNLGNIYVAGSFQSATITFGSFVLNNSGSYNTFLVKYNSAGVVQWAKASTGDYRAVVTDMCADKNGNTYMTGWFNSDSLMFDGIKLMQGGYYDMFVVKYDNNGNAVWAKNAGYDGDDSGYGVAADTAGNVFVGGSFQDSIKFGTVFIKPQLAYYYHPFIVKYDKNGNVIWAKSSSNGESSDEAYDVAADISGNAYLAGYFKSDTITLGSIRLPNASIYNHNGFLAKYDPSGNVTWARRIGGNFSDIIKRVTTDTNANIYIGGDFESATIALDALSLTNFSNADTSYDIFIAKYNTNGNIQWARSAGEARGEYLEGIAVGKNGIPFISGRYNSSSLAFGATILTNKGRTDTYVTNEITRNGMLVPQLCTVTVDSLSKNNVIYWDKTPYTDAKNFIVYRETSINNYKPLATIPYDSLSYFTDTVRTRYFPNTGNPNIGTYRYKLQYMDTSGNYSSLSPYHNTIYIVDNGAGQFSWNPLYTIENTANPVDNYVLMRDDNGTGVWTTVGNVVGNQNTIADPSYASHANGKWRVETQWAITCTPTFIKKSNVDGVTILTTKTVNNSRSNIKDNIAAIGINESNAGTRFSLYPNPANGRLNIEWPELSSEPPVLVIIRNYLGTEIIKLAPEKNKTRTTIDISDLAAGIYCLELKGDKYTALKKLVIE
ncbi:MAG: SBBP repeat-containing protein [Bacteroidetes bacterium]|nr:SBBP repeat-containing protein [Bacteroidota bacterium]